MENKSYKEFYIMFKENLIKDHYTPGIKAEVIWDTLLTDFVPKLIGEHVGDCVPKLIAKEFPIKASEEDTSLRSARIDYLVEGGKNLYIVELKTTNSSFDKVQYERYRDLKTNELWKHYQDVIDEVIHPTYFERTRLNYDKEKYLKHIKYLEQVKQITGEVVFANKDALIDSLKKRIETLKEKELKIVYLSIYKIEELDKDPNTINIVLEEQNQNENSPVPRLILDIIKEIKERDKNYEITV